MISGASGIMLPIGFRIGLRPGFPVMSRIPVLTSKLLIEACETLAVRDAELADIYERLGPPPLWARPAGFATLTHIILEQQVSLASAKAAFERLEAVLGLVDPEGFLRLDDASLKAIGFSRQKTGYVRGLAEAICGGRLELTALSECDDEAVRTSLTALKGIGPWTADIYLLMALGRHDVWPAGDLALALAVRQVKDLPRRPGPEALRTLAEPWRPWRSVAARLLWHHYLNP